MERKFKFLAPNNDGWRKAAVRYDWLNYGRSANYQILWKDWTGIISTNTCRTNRVNKPQQKDGNTAASAAMSPGRLLKKLQETPQDERQPVVRKPP